MQIFLYQKHYNLTLHGIRLLSRRSMGRESSILAREIITTLEAVRG